MQNLITIGQLIDRTWDHYVKFFKTLIKISMWAFILPLLMLIRIFILPNGEMEAIAMIAEGYHDVYLWVGIIFGLTTMIIVIPLITVWIRINLIKAIEYQDKNTTFTLKELREYSWKNLSSYLFVEILKFIITKAPFLLLIPGLALIVSNIAFDGGLFFGILSIITILAGLIAFNIFIVIFWVQFRFPGYELIISNKKGISAIKGSRNLVKGRFFSTFWRLAILFIISKTIQILTLLAMYAVSFITYGLLSINLTFGQISSAIIPISLYTTILILTIPFFVIADYIIYDNLKKTKQ